MTKKKLDPYAELSIKRDADPETIKKAARKRHKQTHPDAGGTLESFERSRTAEMVLLDPIARRKFDETGDIDDVGPDNDRVMALQIIEAFVAEMLQSYITSGFAPHKDPRNDDFLARFIDKIETEVSELDRQPALIDRGIALLVDMKERLTTADPAQPMHRSLEKRIDEFKGQRAQAIKAAEIRRLAIEIAKAHKFRFDPPTEMSWRDLTPSHGFPPVSTRW